MDFFKDKRSFIGIMVLYVLVAFSILSPLANNSLVPVRGDFLIHTKLIKLASLALKEGQFPLRTVSDLNEFDGIWGYPMFQFYGPLLFTLAGYIAKIFSHSNPFYALKLTLFLGSILAAFYIYFFAMQITKNYIAASLAGVAYIMSPYFLINIINRGDFTEAAAQTLLPVVLFHSCQPYIKKKLTFFNFIFTSLMWAALPMFHLITFINTSIFIGIFLIFFKKENWIKNLLYSGLTYIFGIFLAAWYLVPVVFYSQGLRISNFANPTALNYLTSFSKLIAISTQTLSSISFNNTTYDHVLSPPFQPSIGLMGLFAIGLCTYTVYLNPDRYTYDDKKLINLLLLEFSICFFLIWSPFDFWKFIPKIFFVEQFPYRFCSQITWITVLLIAIAINIISKRKNNLQTFILGLTFICLTSSSWLIAEYGMGYKIPEILKMKVKNFNQDYLLKPSQFQENVQQNIVLDHNLVKDSCVKIKSGLSCKILVPSNGLVELPIFYYPNFLSITIDGHNFSYQSIQNLQYNLVGLKLNSGSHFIVVKFIGIAWANKISLFAGSVLIILSLFYLIKRIFKQKILTAENNLIY